MTEFAILLLFGLLAGFAILLGQARLTARGTPVRPLHKIVVKVPSPIGTNSGTDGAKRPGPVDLESISPDPRLLHRRTHRQGRHWLTRG
jgi:hypothetical protein